MSKSTRSKLATALAAITLLATIGGLLTSAAEAQLDRPTPTGPSLVPIPVTPIPPGPTLPGPIQPGPIQPGPTLPGPIQPGPTFPGPIQPGPTIPGPVLPTVAGNLDVAHYNIQFLTPDWWPLGSRVDSDHWPNSSTRAVKIGRTLACNDIITLNESVSDRRFGQLLNAMNEAASSCPDNTFSTSDGRFDVVRGPEIGALNPLEVLETAATLAGVGIEGLFDLESGVARPAPALSDEISIVSRYQVVTSHQMIFSRASGFDRLAAKGVLHARLWRGGDDYIDVYTTHFNAGKNSAHTTQIRELASFIRRTHDRNLPIIINGDFNIDGGAKATAATSGRYPALVSALQAVRSDLRDTGIGDGPTNEQGFVPGQARGDGDNRGAQRIDMMFVAGLNERSSRVDYHEDSAISGGNPTLSDHAAIFGNLNWTEGSVRNRPRSGERLVSLELLHLEATSQDVPAGSAIGACNGLMDFFGSANLSNSGDRSEARFRREGNRIDPQTRLSLPVGADVRSIRAGVIVDDDDDLVCGGGDDSVDINPGRGGANVRLPLRIDLRSNRVELLDSAGRRVRTLGPIGVPLEVRGNEVRRERGNLTFRVDVVEDRTVAVRVDRVRLLQGSDCIGCGALDFKARTAVRTGRGVKTRDFGPINNRNDIRPLWTNTQRARSTDRTARIDLRVREDDDTSGDDVVDIHPASPTDTRLSVDLTNGRVFTADATGRRLNEIGRVNRPITMRGNQFTSQIERAEVTFTVLATVPNLAPPLERHQPSITIDRIRKIRGSDCFLCGDLDFKARVSVASALASRTANFGPMNNRDDIRPGWRVASTSLGNETVTMTVVVTEDDDTGPDDPVDINPNNGTPLVVTATPADGRVRLNGREVGRIGRSITLRGNQFSSSIEQAEITFTVRMR